MALICLIRKRDAIRGTASRHTHTDAQSLLSAFQGHPARYPEGRLPECLTKSQFGGLRHLQAI